MAGDRRLTRSEKRLIAGVCGGIAAYFGWSPGATRIAYVLLSLLSSGFPGLAAYLVLALLMPAPTGSEREFDLDDYRVR